MLLELMFQLECAAPKQLQAGRFLPASQIRLLIDQRLNSLGEQFDHPTINAQSQHLDRAMARKIIAALKPHIIKMTEKGEALASDEGSILIKAAITEMKHRYKSEQQRLEALKRVNPTIRDDELTFLQQQAQLLEHHLSATRVRLDAVRLIVTT